MRRVLSPTLGRFLVVGAVSYLVNQSLLLLLYNYALARLPHQDSVTHGRIDPALLLASIMAVEVSILVRFALNDRWTFRDRCSKPFVERFYQFQISSFASPLISLTAVNVLTPQLGVSYLISNSLGILLGLAWNWFWSNRFVWGPVGPVPLADSGP